MKEIKDEILYNIPIIPLRDLIIFPHMVTHFDAGRTKSVAAIEKAELEGIYVFLTAQKDAKVMEPTIDDIYKFGTLASVKQILKLPGGIVRVLVEGVVRAELSEITKDNELLEGTVIVSSDKSTVDEMELEAIVRLIEEDLREYGDLNTRMIPGILQTVVDVEDKNSLTDIAASYLNLKLEDNQALIEKTNLYDRLILFHEILTREIELLAIENSIDQQVKNQMNKVQREYYLKEQLKAIRKELGNDEDDEEADISYRVKLDNKKLPKEIKEKALKEVNKLSKVNSSSPEYTVIINYLDWILDLPWEESSKEDIDLNKAREVLDSEHYGLKDVKERILEFIAVRKLNKTTKGPILCLVGPPGVGKTSIARSIADALEKEYVRMSLGGVTDEAEIRGHRRTYIGSLPGRVISLLKKAGKNNPVFLLDEIDKVGSDYKGDPASGLLEVLDPEQNSTFTDHYLELPFDLSKVFFITTANTTRTIPRPLLDRMEVLNIEGYTPEEKFNIAKKYLIPKQIMENGLTEDQIRISDNAINDIINYYTREAGVRSLEKEISKITRKSALEIVEKNKSKLIINVGNLSNYLGERKFLYDLVKEEDQVGVVNGLAWTEVGGETLSIEVNVVPGKGKLQMTGQLGEVMKESVLAGFSYIASNSDKYNIDPDFREKHDIHVHVPEGAVPKDGPSAGISMATAIFSALTNQGVKRDIAMTGEITLRGRVLGIGGLKEKLLAAQRMGIKKVIIPYDNKRELKEIDSVIISKLEIIPVKNMDEVIEEAIVRNDISEN